MPSLHVLTNEQIKNILNLESKKFTTITKTIKYIYKSRSSERIKSILSRNVNKAPSVIMKLFWELFKYFVIANELINVRIELFNMMFNKYSRCLDEVELMRLINNPSNQWLDNNYKKISLVSYFLEELLNSTYVCEEVCRISNCPEDEFFSLRNSVISKLENLKFIAFNEFEKSEIARISRARSEITRACLNFSEEAHKSHELYNQSFDDSALLNIVEKEE